MERVLEWRGDEVQLASVLKDVALALHHMHRRGVAHMDVKVRLRTSASKHHGPSSEHTSETYIPPYSF